MCAVRGHLFSRNKEMRLYKKANKSFFGNLRVGGAGQICAPQSASIDGVLITFSVHVCWLYGPRLLDVRLMAVVPPHSNRVHLTWSKVTKLIMSQHLVPKGGPLGL